MEVEARREKEKEDYEQERLTREMECAVKTQKKAIKRRIKKEKAKLMKEAAKANNGKGPLSDGTFLDKVKAKYGQDVLVQEESQDSAS